MVHRRHRYSVWSLLCVAIVSAFVIGCADSDSAPAPAPTPGPVMTGGVDAIDSVLAANQGKWVMVNVWATWCRPCVAETPDLVAFANSLHGRPFTMLGLSTDIFTADDTAAVRKVTQFQSSKNIPYTNLVFTGTVDELTDRLGLSGSLPETILFDPAGKVSTQYIGLVEKSELEGIAKTIGGA